MQEVGGSIPPSSTIKKILSMNLLEQKINFTFKELVLILDIFQISFTCITGFKELNGSQVSKENITSKRTSSGISIENWNDVVGKEAEQDFSKDSIIKIPNGGFYEN